MARQADKHIREYRKIVYALCVSLDTRTLTGKILICLGKKTGTYNIATITRIKTYKVISGEKL